MNSVISVLLFGALTASSVLLFVPQLLRLVRFKDPAGLSAASLLFGSVNYLGWTVYLLDSRSWGLFAVNIAAGVVWFAVVALAFRSIRPGRSWWPPLAWSLVLSGVVLLDRPALGSVLGAGALLTYTPQAVGVWRSASLAGVSATTWSIAAVEGALWLVESLRDGLVGGVAFGVIVLVAAASVLTAVAVRRERGAGREPLSPVPPDPTVPAATVPDPGLVRPGPARPRRLRVRGPTRSTGAPGCSRRRPGTRTLPRAPTLEGGYPARARTRSMMPAAVPLGLLDGDPEPAEVLDRAGGCSARPRAERWRGRRSAGGPEATTTKTPRGRRGGAARPAGGPGPPR